MITADQYFNAHLNHHEITPRMIENARALLDQVNDLLDACVQLGWQPRVNWVTGTLIAGQKFGGWRPSTCTIGSPNSAHKQARAVDVADVDGSLDGLISDELLEAHGLYREHPADTPTWCHLTDRAPNSGRRTFKP